MKACKLLRNTLFRSFFVSRVMTHKIALGQSVVKLRPNLTDTNYTGVETTLFTNSGVKHMRPLNERMKHGELYVIYTGWGDNCEYISMLTYGDRERTPRIYKQGAVDERILPSTPICKTLATANTKLGPKTHGVALPLSEMIQIFNKRSCLLYTSDAADE